MRRSPTIRNFEQLSETEEVESFDLLKNGGNFISDNIFSLDDVALINYCYYKFDNAFICKGERDLESIMNLLNKDDIPNNFDLLIAYQFQEQGHCAAIKVERREEKNKIIVMDSLGSKGDPINNELFMSISNKCHNADIFYMKNKRQIDYTSCRVFSAKDLSKASKTENLHQELYKKLEVEGLSQPEIICGNNVYMCDMPERFLVFAQAKRLIKNYDSDEKIFLRKNGLRESIKEKILRKRSGEDESPDSDATISKEPEMIYYFKQKYQNFIFKLKLHASDVRDIINKQSPEALNREKLYKIASGFDRGHYITSPKLGATLSDKTEVTEL